MAGLIPIILSGSTLGSRHQHLNSLVNDAYQKSVHLNSIQGVPENSPIDRIFKINLASRYKDLDYILKNLKETDMLYVSTALKSVWLLDQEYKNIINPIYLEDVLYPQMTTTAVNKMKHWIELNLKDPQRCEEFYRYYIAKNFDTGIKFIWKCPVEVVLKEFSKVDMMEKLTPHRFKLLCEKCPAAVQMYYDNRNQHEFLHTRYMEKENSYMSALKIVLKIDGNVYLDIIEKHAFHSGTLSAEATKYIIKHHKERFDRKPELYASKFLDIGTLAKHLNQDEIKGLILKLAQAEYLQQWFTYKNVAPLIKAIRMEERPVFKKQVFVDKDVGDKVKEWPYEIPSFPEFRPMTGKGIFEDATHDPNEYDIVCEPQVIMKCGGRMKRNIMNKSALPCSSFAMVKRKTSLDELFDLYRFVSFDKTLFELRKRMLVDTTKHRQNMMLVLISKSGGKAESLEQLLSLWTSRYENEPENLRATVIRSLVRRCSAWRLGAEAWALLLRFGRGLGLSGEPATVACAEGLHAAVLRDLLHDTQVDPDVWKAYMNNFSTLTEYSLNAAEKQKISTKLPELLLASATSDVENAVDRLKKTLDVLEAYKIRIDRNADLIRLIAETANKDKKAESLLLRLFKARIARKELFKQNFDLIKSNASYLNALKHDTSILQNDSFTELIKTNALAHDQFLKALSLYFNEEDGLAKKYLTILLNYTNEAPKEELVKRNLARSIAILSGNKIEDILDKFNHLFQISIYSTSKSERRRFTSLLKANAHLVRPLLDIKTFEMQAIGAKAIANRVLTCSKNDVDENVQALLAWPKTQKLALILSMRIDKAIPVLEFVVNKRPQQALKTILRHLKTQQLGEDIWDVIIPLIAKVHNAGKIHDRLRKALSNVSIVPDTKKAKYYTTCYKVFRQISAYAAMPMLCNIENIISEVDVEFIENVTKQYLNEDFTAEKLKKNNYTNDICVKLQMRLIAKYLLMCKTEADVETKWRTVGEPFFDNCEKIWTEWDKHSEFLEYMGDFFVSLKFTKVFLDTSYGCCLLMFERIINRLQTILPLHEHYGLYIKLHLTMLYYKSLRQSIKNNPVIFEDLPKKINQAAEIVGRVFGKYIAHEVVLLTEKYFESIKHIYKRELVKFLRDNYSYGESRSIFILNIVKGILEGSPKSHPLAEHVFSEDAYSWPEKDRKETLENLKKSNDMELVFFLHSNLNKHRLLYYPRVQN